MKNIDRRLADLERRLQHQRQPEQVKLDQPENTLERAIGILNDLAALGVITSDISCAQYAEMDALIASGWHPNDALFAVCGTQKGKR